MAVLVDLLLLGIRHISAAGFSGVLAASAFAGACANLAALALDEPGIVLLDAAAYRLPIRGRRILAAGMGIGMGSVLLLLVVALAWTGP